MPKENRSVRASGGLPSTCSGDMQATVPSVEPGLVRRFVSGQGLGGGYACGGGALLIDFGEPKIEEFGMAALGDKDIGGLDVAMKDASRVGGVEGVSQL